jgi:hypothetical protein
LVGKAEGRDHSENVNVNGKTILEWILGKGVDLIHLAQNKDQWPDSFEDGNVPLVCIGGREFLD